MPSVKSVPLSPSDAVLCAYIYIYIYIFLDRVVLYYLFPPVSISSTQSSVLLRRRRTYGPDRMIMKLLFDPLTLWISPFLSVIWTQGQIRSQYQGYSDGAAHPLYTVCVISQVYHRLITVQNDYFIKYNRLQMDRCELWELETKLFINRSYEVAK